MSRSASVAILCCLLLAGCGDRTDSNKPVTQTPKTISAVTGGMKRYDLKGLSIEVPADWQIIDFTQGDFNKIMDSMAEKNPSMQKTVPMIRQLASSGGMKMYAFDFKDAKDGFTPNLNIIETPVPMGTSFSQLVEANKQQMSSISKIQTDGPAKLGGLDGHSIESEMPLNTQTGSSVKVQLLSYIVMRDDKQLTVTFSTTSDQADRMRETATSAIRSIEFR